MSHTLILASGSAARRDMLKRCGLQFEIAPSRLDEDRLIAELHQKGKSAEDMALSLAISKAQQISQQKPAALVVGSDQILWLSDKIIQKAAAKNEAIEKLKMLRGKTHELISAVAVCLNGAILWSHTAKARLVMHDFDDDFLQSYADAAGDALIESVGAYQIENHGAWLFSEIEGDVFTILGMPLLPLLSYLRDHHGIRP